MLREKVKNGFTRVFFSSAAFLIAGLVACGGGGGGGDAAAGGGSGSITYTPVAQTDTYTGSDSVFKVDTTGNAELTYTFNNSSGSSKDIYYIFTNTNLSAELTAPSFLANIADVYDKYFSDDGFSSEKSLFSESGTSGADSLAMAAVEHFCMALGSVAGDFALAHGASGVVIAGGLGYRIRETLLASSFAERFRFKGRYEQLMAGLPVKLITHPQPGLFGAVAAFAREHTGS